MPHQFILAAVHEIAHNNKILIECVYFFATDVLCVTNWAIRYNASAIACDLHLVCAYARYQVLVNTFPILPSSRTEVSRLILDLSTRIRTESVVWFEKLDPCMTHELLNEMSPEFVSTYKSCRKWLEFTRFVAKGIEKPSTPSPSPA
ncbi:hypothetical protein ANCCAN_05807 [Ancylostoma caninum]|uniref:Uncharacterized protein n=1 Tax=Ancylostoma caninum TaxID=29170 RepID=A0A368GUT1_ANCCA|nr:hypothetical protein ANCCAN_05807 [Ancylostoma caninum]